MNNELIVYTKNNCVYCDMMKAKLTEWGFDYSVVNIQEDSEAKAFIVLDQGHRTVPQLYYGLVNVNRDIDTENLTKDVVEDFIGYLDDVK
jgi:glutaredoxin